jgi:hypothetical protein
MIDDCYGETDAYAFLDGFSRAQRAGAPSAEEVFYFVESFSIRSAPFASPELLYMVMQHVSYPFVFESDIYAFGGVLYFLLTGIPPWSRQNA